MKKSLLVLGLLCAAVSFAQDDKMCECHTWQLEIANQFKKTQSMEELMKIKEENKDKIANCKKIVDAYEARLAEMTKKEKKKTEKAYRKSCPAFVEMEKIKKQVEKAK